jgi:DNA-binding MarR family transcriptional regulator
VANRSSAFDVDPERSIGYLLRSTSRLVLGELTDRLAPHGVTLGQYFVLRELWENEGATQRELSARVGIPEPSTVAALDALGRRGLVERVRSTTDRRKIHVHLTAEGRALRRELLGHAQSIINGATDDFTTEEIETLRGLLQRLKANLARTRVGVV